MSDSYEVYDKVGQAHCLAHLVDCWAHDATSMSRCGRWSGIDVGQSSWLRYTRRSTGFTNLKAPARHDEADPV